MSCGLGAVILMFLLVKKNSQEEITETSIIQNNLETEVLKKDPTTKNIWRKHHNYYFGL